jgi:hypothetical protein
MADISAKYAQTPNFNLLLGVAGWVSIYVVL